MDTIRLTAADFLEKLETAVAERSVERMTAMEYAEKLIADKERDKTVFDNSQRNLIVNFAYKLDDRAATEELANNLAAAVAAENTEEINRLMWEAEEKIESLPDGMIGLSEMHEYGYLKDDVLPLTKEGAREWHRLGERIYPLFQDGTAGDFASQEEIEQHDGIFGIKADAWSAILLEKNEEYLEDEYARPDAALTVISREQALRLFDEGKQIYLIRVSPWPVLVTGREEIERGSDYFQIAQEDLEKDKQKAMENSEKTPVEKLAVDLDDFAFDVDFYHYKDSVEDREQAVEALKEQIQAGDIQPIREWLQVAVEESEGESAEKAAELITRLDALVKEQKLLSGSEKQFGIYQITARDPEHDYRFMNLDFVKRHGMEVNRADYELVYTEPLTEKDTLEAIYERFNIQRPTDFTGHSLSVSDVVVLNDGKSIKACYVDSIGFAELPDFFKERKMDLKKETILDGCAGTWMATEECVVESQHFFLMQHEVYKEKAPNVIVDASGKLVSTEIRKGLDEDARKKILDYLHPPLMEKPMNQKPSLHQMEHYQKFYENGEYVRAVESTTEQNYNMIDGCANNLPKPRIINGRESVLDKLRIRQMTREKQKSSQEQSADMERNRK